MKDLIIFGAGSFGREVAQLVQDINMQKKEWNLLGFVDETPEKIGRTINGVYVLGGLEWLEKNNSKSFGLVCAIGNPRDKYDLIKRISFCSCHYVNLVHPEAKISSFASIGNGNIICWNTFLSVNTKIGNFISINPGGAIGHDAVIDDFSTLYWNVTLSGNVHICEGCEIGSKVVVIPKRVVGGWSILGAGTVVVKDIPSNCTAAGVPARLLHRAELNESEPFQPKLNFGASVRDSTPTDEGTRYPHL